MLHTLPTADHGLVEVSHELLLSSTSCSAHRACLMAVLREQLLLKPRDVSLRAPSAMRLRAGQEQPAPRLDCRSGHLRPPLPCAGQEGGGVRLRFGRMRRAD